MYPEGGGKRTTIRCRRRGGGESTVDIGARWTGGGRGEGGSGVSTLALFGVFADRGMGVVDDIGFLA